MKIQFKIKGMHCKSCAILIEDKLKDKVNKVSISYDKEEAIIDYNENKITEEKIKKLIISLGSYKVE